MSIKAWPEGRVLEIRSLHPEPAQLGNRWVGVNERGQEIRIAFVWGQLCIGVGMPQDGKDGGLWIVQDVDEVSKEGATLAELSVYFSRLNLPVKWMTHGERGN